MTLRDLYPPIIALAACLGLACSDDKDPLDSATNVTAASANPTASSNGSNASNSGNASNDTNDTNNDTTATDDSGPATDTSGATEGDGTDGTDAAPTSGEPTLGTTMGADTTSTATTEPAPTDGPGVLPGEDGMDAFCRRYKECGGTYYGDQQECLQATYDYWGDCPSRKAALDGFGECMSELDCSEWNPDAYNPGSTPCAQQWGEVESSDPC
ncbi:hypothetical protein [Nannocystis radixulma]|uniref:Uncharacterized protein n=1 Tax=Nannocystis radixulma TaxID=2995305 RepID=A0ABT5BJM8_9BACT|nr:hypothetical protein [Nannocystis radixulma]MDC0674357.1 hypothetical protein [Nannocystis radixulma]